MGSLNYEWPCSRLRDTVLCRSTTWSQVVRDKGQPSETPSPPPQPPEEVCYSSATDLLTVDNVIIGSDDSSTWPALTRLTPPPPRLAVVRSSKSASKSKKSASVSQVDVYEGPDQISELSNDILSIILSLLDMKDAAKTSILSTRWRYTWTYREDLIFEHKTIMKKRHTISNHLNIHGQRSKYIDMVDQALKVHHGELVNKFKIGSIFEAPFHYQHIDSWVKFALSKKVKELYLDAPVFLKRRSKYTLDFKFLNKTLLSETGISRLTTLHLNHVNVSGEFLQYVVLRCQLLEQLVVRRSHDLVRFNVVNPSMKLNHLTIMDCHNLKQLEIDAACLTSFHFGSVSNNLNRPQVLFKNVPSLVQAAFCGSACYMPDPIFPQITCISKQLSKLYVGFQHLVDSDYYVDMQSVPCFSNVEYLELLVSCTPEHDLHYASDFLRAFPMLRDLTLRVKWRSKEDPIEAPKLSSNDAIDELGEPENNETFHIKLSRIMVDGFLGCPHDVELLLDIVKFAPSLEIITCQPGKDATQFSKTIFAYRCLSLERILPPQINVISSECE